jgi:hypothetical protein
MGYMGTTSESGQVGYDTQNRHPITTTTVKSTHNAVIAISLGR